MAIVIDGDGTVSGISVGGLPDGIVDSGTLASNAVTNAKITDGAVDAAALATNSVDSAELIDGSIDNSHIDAMAASKLTGALPAIDGSSLTGIVGRKNLIINGGFDVWQRGTSFTADNVFIADRWKSGDGTGGTPARTASRQSFTVGQTDVPNEPTYYLRHQQTGAATSGNSSIAYRIEGVRTGAGQQITLSFYAKQSSTVNHRIRIIQNFGTGGSTSVTHYDTDHSIGTSWAKTTITTTLPSISGKTIAGGNDLLQIDIECRSTSTYTFDIAQVQLELGSVATDFEQRSYGEELALCQRYFYQMSASANGYIASIVYKGSTRYMSTVIPSMRDTPTLSYGTARTSTNGAAYADVTPSLTAYVDGGDVLINLGSGAYDEDVLFYGNLKYDAEL